jgi:hypothetical protein
MFWLPGLMVWVTYIFVKNDGNQCASATSHPNTPAGVCTVNNKPFGVAMTTPEYIIPSNINCAGGCVLQWVSGGLLPVTSIAQQRPK